MIEPLIVGYGRTCIDMYSLNELRDSLVTAFKWKKARSVILDDCMTGQRFRAASVAWAIDEGLLCVDEIASDDQSVVSSFVLTDRGREELLK